MRTDDLIVQLASEAGPVRPLASARARFAVWVIVSAPLVAAAAVGFGVRRDLVERLADSEFALSVAVIGALALVAAALAIVTSVPDDRRPRVTRGLPAVLAVVWSGALVANLAAGPGVAAGLAADPGHFPCALQISLMAIVPGLVLWRAAHAGRSVEPAWTGAWTVVAASAAGAVGAAVICPLDASAHQLLWHFLPVAALGAAGAFAGRLWLDRFRR